MASPPKPWERAGAGATSTTALAPATPSTSAASAASGIGAAPAIPARPATLSSVVNQNASTYSGYGASTGYGATPYGGYGSTYGSTMGGVGGYSPYNRFGAGGYGSMYGGTGMGGYGSMYGGAYGGGMYGRGYGMNGMTGMNGMPMDPNNPSLTQSFSQSTQATFQLIEGIVGAFGGFAQMLESTYMATHSSFFAMVSVAEQFGNLKQTLGSVLGIFTIMRWIKTLYAKITGRPMPASSKQLTPAKFAEFTGKLPDGTPTPPKPSRKPFIIFMLAVFGLPYLMGKLIKALAKGQEEEAKRRQEAGLMMDGGVGEQPVDPSKLDFCRVMYDFTPEAHKDLVPGIDLAVKKGDLVAVLSKTDPLGNPSEWWRCRSRDGRMGYLPSPYLEAIQRKPVAAITAGGSQPVSPVGSRAQTMTGSVSAPGSRLSSMLNKDQVKIPAPAPKIEGKMGDISPESFQKGGFYS